MLGQLTQKRRGIRDMLRQRQLDQQFSQRRGLLPAPSPDLARDILEQTLKEIKWAIQKNDISNLHSLLLQFRVVAESYNLAQCLATSVFFPVDLPEVQMGQLPLECAWVQVFCILLDKEQDRKIQKELLKIINLAFYQLRLSIGKLKDLAVELLTELIQHLPYKLCDNKNYQVWTQLCQLFGEALISAELLGVQQALLAKPSPLVDFLFLLTTDSEFFQVAEARINFIQVSLLLIAIEITLAESCQNMESFKDFVASLMVQNFSWDEIQLTKNYEYLNIFVLKGGRLKNAQISVLQKLVYKQGQREAIYYEMLNCLLCFHSYVLDIQTISFLIECIFLEKDEDFERLQSKKWMILVLKQHLSNRGNQWTSSEKNIFFQMAIKNQIKLQQTFQSFRENNQITEVLNFLFKKALFAPNTGLNGAAQYPLSAYLSNNNSKLV